MARRSPVAADEFYIVVSGTGRYRMEDKRLPSSRTIWVIDAASNAAGSSSLAMNATANTGAGAERAAGLAARRLRRRSGASIGNWLGYTEQIGSGRDGG
jgi:hypothetical protein